jgi:hypothetical protein
MLSSLTIALQLGFGLSMGSRAIIWDPEPDITVTCSRELSIWSHALCVVAIVTSMVVLLNLKPVLSNMLGVYVCAAVGLYTSRVLDEASLLTSDFRSFVAALMVGVVGGLHARWRRRQNL